MTPSPTPATGPSLAQFIRNAWLAGIDRSEILANILGDPTSTPADSDFARELFNALEFDFRNQLSYY